jgi:hypothetical protein
MNVGFFYMSVEKSNTGAERFTYRQPATLAPLAVSQVSSFQFPVSNGSHVSP